jgi:hypothetical protein
MSKPRFQVMIVPANTSAPVHDASDDRFAVEQQSRTGEKIAKGIDDLAAIWDDVVKKLTDIAEKSGLTAAASKFELSSIEFHVGIEAGLAVGLVTKGDASISVTFTRKDKSVDSPVKHTV